MSAAEKRAVSVEAEAEAVSAAEKRAVSVEAEEEAAVSELRREEVVIVMG